MPPSFLQVNWSHLTPSSCWAQDPFLPPVWVWNKPWEPDDLHDDLPLRLSSEKGSPFHLELKGAQRKLRGWGWVDWPDWAELVHLALLGCVGIYLSQDFPEPTVGKRWEESRADGRRDQGGRGKEGREGDVGLSSGSRSLAALPAPLSMCPLAWNRRVPLTSLTVRAAWATNRNSRSTQRPVPHDTRLGLYK